MELISNLVIFLFLVIYDEGNADGHENILSTQLTNSLAGKELKAVICQVGYFYSFIGESRAVLSKLLKNVCQKLLKNHLTTLTILNQTWHTNASHILTHIR